ncbi:alpha/beta fold hydrolase [Aeromonas veronii]|uniref:alpha/beta fold hydrolase n=1 Tax=Aeromonas veronii TaxID=654 RepID=UPI0032EFE409
MEVEESAALSVADSFVSVPGGRLFVRQWRPAGTGHSPLILLHDSLGSVAQWRDFPATLATRLQRPVIAYDRLGFGQSSPQTEPAKPGFIDDEARFYLPTLIKALGLGHYLLFGHSVGGAMALAATSRPSSGCLAVISESTQAFVEERTLDGIRVAKQGFEDEAQLVRLTRWHGERARWVLDAWTGVWLSPAFRHWSLAPRLADVHCPVLAIHGEKDEFGSAAFPRAIAGGVSGAAQMALLPDCGHVPHREREAEVLDLVETFLSRHRIG